ncbi:MAG: iron uptake porin [Phormidesmis sp. CAN_BIN36]|nr:iron uptake porin [Phormidesmis sp. CAN_BIN36]
MFKFLLNSLVVSPALLGATLAISSGAIAAEKSVAISTSPVATIAAKTQEIEALVAPSIEVKTAQAANVAALEVIQAKGISEKAAELKPSQTAPVQIAQVSPAAPSSDLNSIDQINRYSREGKPNASIGQVTSVSQLSDVRPTDWAFQALQSLVERYGCIAGYPDKTYRGNRALTRFEFAAGLNACLDRVNELIAAATADLVKKEDLATLQRLQEEFAAELATLRGRVDALEARTSTLEKQQFSTTTKLAGEVIFAVTDEFGVRNTRGNNTVFQDRVRLALNTSFTGSDLLVTRLAAGNAGAFNLQNPNRLAAGQTSATNAEGLQTFNFGNTTNNRIFADWVAYFFNLTEKVRVYVPAVGGLHYDYAPTVSPALDAFDGGTGPLSLFAQRNPIYSIGGGAGAGVNFELTPAFTISGGYLADNSGVGGAPVTGANNPSDKNGLFNGSYSALAQITFKPSQALSLGLTYVNAYRRSSIFDTGAGGSGINGTLSANQSLSNRRVNGVAPITPSQVNAYGVEVAFRLSPKIVLNGFGSYINADFVNDGIGSRTIWTYGAGLAFPDFGKKGNLLGFMAGAEPYLSNPTAVQRRGGIGNSIPLHLEGFYKYQLNDNISITPGVIWVINPGQNDNNDDVVIGTVRTTFTF